MAITISGSGITSANIADGTIVNADIKSDAAIAASKLTGTELSFGANLAANVNISTGIWTNLILGTELWDTDSAYDTASGKFTVPTGEAGRYVINGGIELQSVVADKIVQITYRKNGSALPGSSHRDYPPNSSPDIKFTSTTIMDLAEGDYIEMYMYHNSGSTELLNSNETFFGGFKL